MSQHSFQPVILLGAARSGTKVLRDTIGLHPQFDRVPYDVNYIWRMGNERLPHDELDVGQLTPEIQRRIVRQLSRYSTGRPYLIEKTVGNCLRVPFVHAVFPDAKFIHLVRDGRDVVESSLRQWQAPPDWGYILRKARSFPLAAAPRYAAHYALQTAKRLLGRKEKSIPTWGPVYRGIDDDLRRESLLEVCARQWAISVKRSLAGLAQVPDTQRLQVRYEEFVAAPAATLRTIAAFLGADLDACESVRLHHISAENTGKGMRGLNSTQQEQVLALIGPTLMQLGYLVPTDAMVTAP